MLLRSKVLSTNRSGLGHSNVQLMNNADSLNLYMCLAVHTDAKLQQVVYLSFYIAEVQLPSNRLQACPQLVLTSCLSLTL